MDKDKQEWEEEFVKVFPPQEYEDRSEGYYLKADYSVIKRYIQNLLSQEREKLVSKFETFMFSGGSPSRESLIIFLKSLKGTP